MSVEKFSVSFDPDLGRAIREAANPVVAQVWRDGARQVRLARALVGIDQVALDPSRAKSIGELLASSRTADAVDASIVEIAEDIDEIVTSDPTDLRHLARVAGISIAITSI